MASGEGFVLLPGEARTIRIGSFDVLVHADAERTGGVVSMVETADAEPGAGPPLHIHHDAAESFWVLAGEYRMHVDGRDFRCPAGSFVHVPRGLPHTFSALTAPSRKLNIYSPAAMVGYFDELADALERGVDERELARIAERYSMEIVGPVPEGYV